MSFTVAVILYRTCESFLVDCNIFSQWPVCCSPCSSVFIICFVLAVLLLQLNTLHIYNIHLKVVYWISCLLKMCIICLSFSLFCYWFYLAKYCKGIRFNFMTQAKPFSHDNLHLLYNIFEILFVPTPIHVKFEKILPCLYIYGGKKCLLLLRWCLKVTLLSSLIL